MVREPPTLKKSMCNRWFTSDISSFLQSVHHRYKSFTLLIEHIPALETRLDACVTEEFAELGRNVSYLSILFIPLFFTVVFCS